MRWMSRGAMLGVVLLIAVGAGCGDTTDQDRARLAACNELGDANPESDDEFVAMARRFSEMTDDLAYGDVVSAGNPIIVGVTILDRERDSDWDDDSKSSLIHQMRTAADNARSACVNPDAP